KIPLLAGGRGQSAVRIGHPDTLTDKLLECGPGRYRMSALEFLVADSKQRFRARFSRGIASLAPSLYRRGLLSGPEAQVTEHQPEAVARGRPGQTPLQLCTSLRNPPHGRQKPR